MPRLFDYECHVCTNIFEAFELVGTHATPHCPACGSKETHRKFPIPKVVGLKRDFDLLDKRPPDPPIFSGPNARSK
jgi:putative FmdB family regulatory protein